MPDLITQKKQPDSQDKVERILNPTIKRWFFSRFKEFSLPQLYGVSEIHSRKNILVSAPTGATKTLTAFLAVLNELVDSAQKGILEDKTYAVYISPLKALNNDIQKNLLEPLQEISELVENKLGIRVAVRTGDTTTSEKATMLKKPPHILITTPESMAILLSSIRFVDHLKDVQWCIIDEIHALAENKRGVHLSLSLERLQRLSPGITRVGLSATVAPIEEIARFLVGNGRPCQIVDVQFLKDMDLKVLSPVPNLIESTHDRMHDEMYRLMDELIQDHKTTLIFTNTRAATERVVHHLKDRFPKNYTENIGAHHGSLSKEMRLSIEERLRQGKLKVVVSSTSLELGIDIGYIDLVILLGSPKSVARALQRIGRSGHRLHDTTKGRIIVLDRDDLIECSVLLKSAIEKKIDKIHIPSNSLDVLAQHVHGIALEQQIHIDELYSLVTGAYTFRDLQKVDLREIVEYLAGKFVSLEDRYIYAKIWYDDQTGMIGKKGKMSRVIHMTNIGTIPDQSGVIVKVGMQPVGVLDEVFLERLKRGDIFLLGGSTYEFKFSRGNVAQVVASGDRPPTVPQWVSEMLPLSFDLAVEIGRFRRLVEEKLKKGLPKKEVIDFINGYLYVDKNGANAIYEYCREQYDYVKELPSDKKILIENYKDERGRKFVVFHALFGRRVNDCLSRAIAYAIAKTQHRDVEMGINDNGFYIGYTGSVNVMSALKLIKSKDFIMLLNIAIDQTEILKRRFRHCAQRALMILRNYKGRTKKVGRQQVSSMILMTAVKRISPNFCILREARREVLEDLMDIENATEVLRRLEDKKIKMVEIDTNVPSPFAFNIVLMGHMDILKMEDKMEFLRRMHNNVMLKISLDKGKRGIKPTKEDFDYINFWEESKKKIEEEKDKKKQELVTMVLDLKKVPLFAKEELLEHIRDGRGLSDKVERALYAHREEIRKTWPKKLVREIRDFLK